MHTPTNYLKGRSMNKILYVDGITCEHCVDTIKEAVGILGGVFSVDVDIEKNKLLWSLMKNWPNQKI